jgi:uncharacterized protein
MHGAYGFLVPHTTPHLALRVLPGRFTIARFPANAPVPEWALEPSALASVVRTADELSVLAEASRVPEGCIAERGFCALGVCGPLAFELVGILASIATPLAAAAVSIFAVSTYDTDYVLVHERDLDRARDALTAAGHTIDG